METPRASAHLLPLLSGALQRLLHLLPLGQQRLRRAAAPRVPQSASAAVHARQLPGAQLLRHRRVPRRVGALELLQRPGELAARERAERVQGAVRILDAQRVDFEYDGEMAADVALNKELMAAYPFCRLSDTANVLVMPAFHSAAISTKMLQELGGATVMGPLIVGLDKPVQIVQLGAKDTDIVNMAALAAFNVGG